MRDADFIDFDAIVSTSSDQLAIAPGYLQKEWKQGDRRFFHYKMDSPILNFYSFLSGRYQVKKQNWNGVSLEIWYQKGHAYNLERMFNGMKKSLAYYTTNFSPYQHRQVRIIEFPRYATFAQSFPNTIPFSEGVGFIADVESDENNVDYPFYITAHEVAHQWFAHQVTGADVEGSNMLSETLAQYGAIMTLEKEYGEKKIMKFLSYEMDDYLNSRSHESEKEKPLALADIGQGYILYQKGGIVMYGLSKYIGEDSLNSAIRRFVQQYAFKAPPYPTTMDFVQNIRQFTPDSMQYFVSDVFEKIVFYENKISDAKLTSRDTSHYSIALTVNSAKKYADSLGKEIPALMNDYVEVGVYDRKGNQLYLQRYKFKQGDNKLSISVTRKPFKVVVDPRHLLFDKRDEDNEKVLKI
jgi:aminopeptidase N